MNKVPLLLKKRQAKGKSKQVHRQVHRQAGRVPSIVSLSYYGGRREMNKVPLLVKKRQAKGKSKQVHRQVHRQAGREKYRLKCRQISKDKTETKKESTFYCLFGLLRRPP